MSIIIHEGDILCCPQCGAEMYKAVVDIEEHSIAKTADFEPVPPQTMELPGEPIQCDNCGYNPSLKELRMNIKYEEDNNEN